MSQDLPILPGATLGMLGGGQLGRMFVSEALRMGYAVWVLDPDPHSPAGALATRHLNKSYTDTQALDEIAKHCAAVTIEFENIPAQSVLYLSERVRVNPSVSCVEIAQDRRLEKSFVAAQGLPTANFAAIECENDIEAAAQHVGFPCILKTARLGYDGKGQAICHAMDDVKASFIENGEVACVLEERIDLAAEVSVVLARSDENEIVCFPVGENTHRNGILDLTCVPASVAQEITEQAVLMAQKLATALDYVGVLAVEFFVDKDNQLRINEMAPRPHNSGHYTLDATVTSQFEQQVRMLCGLRAGSVALLSPVIMLNVLGDSWSPVAPDWRAVHAVPGAKSHLYGKAEPRAGRKMGHVNLLSSSVEKARESLPQLRAHLHQSSVLSG